MIKVNSNKKLTIILLVLGIIFAVTTFNIRNFSFVQVNDEISLEDNNKSKLRSASYDWDPQITRSVGYIPFGVFIGDANNDGLNDIVSSNVGDNDVSILLWNAVSGDWDTQITRSVGGEPYVVFIGDANNDGLNDIVTANNMDDDVSILLWNATSGDWDPQITRSVGNYPFGVFIGDADNDGSNDIVTANGLDNDVSILLWNAISGDWYPQITRSVGDLPINVFIGDADNDGLNDIATTNLNDDDVSILLWNATSGDWDMQITRPVGVRPRGVFIEDADNDGLNDIVTANGNDDNVSILLWNATSGDWDPQISRSVGLEPGIVFIGDANNDAWNDIVVSNARGDNVSILLWNAPIPTITIDTPENTTYIKSMDEYYPAIFGFENQLSGVLPNDWIIHQSSGTAYLRTVDELDGHKKVLDFYSGVNGDYCYYEKNLKMNVTNGTIEFWFQTTDVSPPTWYSWFMLSDGISESERNIRLCIRDGTLTFHNSTDYFLVDSIVPNQWYHLRIDFNMIADTSTIYLNNELKLSNVDNYGNGSQINTLQVTNHYNLANTHLYLDAIGYSWDPHYIIGDNLEEGLLLSFENTTTLDWMGYSMDGQAIRTILGNKTFPIPDDGPHTVQVFGNTSIGFMIQSDIRHFSVDTISPSITINTPSQNDFFGVNAPSFDISINETNLETVWYTIDGGANNYTITSLSGTINQAAWDAAPTSGIDAGVDINIRFYAKDLAGNIGSNEVSVRKLNKAISGYHLIILIGLISLITGIKIKKKHNSK